MKRGKRTICDWFFFSFFSLSPSNTYISAQTPNPPHTHSVGGYESGRDRFLLLTSFQSFKSVKIVKLQRATLCMTSKHPHDQRFWETDEWECGWLKMTQMLLFYISAHLYVVFLEDDRTLEYLYLGSVACVRVEDEALRGMFVFTFIPHCVSTVFPNVSVSLGVLLKDCCVCVRARTCVCVDAGCTVDSSLCQILSLVFSLMFWWQ